MHGIISHLIYEQFIFFEELQSRQGGTLFQGFKEAYLKALSFQRSLKPGNLLHKNTCKSASEATIYYNYYLCRYAFPFSSEKVKRLGEKSISDQTKSLIHFYDSKIICS